VALQRCTVAPVWRICAWTVNYHLLRPKLAYHSGSI